MSVLQVLYFVHSKLLLFSMNEQMHGIWSTNSKVRTTVSCDSAAEGVSFECMVLKRNRFTLDFTLCFKRSAIAGAPTTV